MFNSLQHFLFFAPYRKLNTKGLIVSALLVVCSSMAQIRDPFLPDCYFQYWSQFDPKKIKYGGCMKTRANTWAILVYPNQRLRTVKIGDYLMSYLQLEEIEEKVVRIKNNLTGEVVSLPRIGIGKCCLD